MPRQPGLRDTIPSGSNTRTLAPARGLAAETLKLERTLSGLVNHAYGLRAAETELHSLQAALRISC